MWALTFVNTKMHNKVVLINNIKIKLQFKDSSFPQFVTGIFLQHPPPHPQYIGPYFLGLCWEALVMCPQWSFLQCGNWTGNCWPARSILGQQHSQLNASHWADSVFYVDHLSGTKRYPLWSNPFSSIRKILCNPDPAQPTAIQPCSAKVKSQLKLNFAFLCFTLLLFPVLIFPLESLQKRRLAGPRPDLEISPFPGQRTSTQ